MALKTTSVPTNVGHNIGDPSGEVRLDSEGKGYWYSFKKNKKKVSVPEKVVQKEEPELVVKPKVIPKRRK